MRAPSDRRTFVSLALQSVVSAFVYSTYLARLPDIRDRTGISIPTLGAVMTVGNLAGFAGCFVAAAVIRRLGSKLVLIVGGALYVFALPVIGTSRSPLLLVVAIVGMMIMNVLVDVAAAMQSTQFSARRGATVMGRLSGFYSVGTVGGGLAASAIAVAGIDVSLHLLVLAALLAAALLVVGPGLLRTDEQPAEEKTTADRPAPRRGMAWLTWPLVVLGVASAMAVPLDVVPGEWATFRVRDDLGGSQGAAAAAYFTFAVGMAVGRLVADWATERLGRRTLARVGPVVSAAGLALAALAPFPAAVYAGLVVAGLGIAPVAPLLTEAAARTPGPPGSGLRQLFVGNRFAGMLTPIAVGSLAGTGMDVGTAMVTVVVPCAALLTVSAVAAVRRGAAAPPPRGLAGVRS